MVGSELSSPMPFWFIIYIIRAIITTQREVKHLTARTEHKSLNTTSCHLIAAEWCKLMLFDDNNNNNDDSFDNDSSQAVSILSWNEINIISITI